MKPRNKQEKEVERLHNLLPSLSMEQMNWIIGQDCEYSARKYAEQGGKKMFENYSYYSVVETFDGWQVVRHFLIHSKTKKAGYDFGYLNEVSQRWMRLDQYGLLELHIFEKPKVMGWQWHKQPYSLGSPLSLKIWNNDYNRAGRTLFGCADEEIYPVREFSDQFKNHKLARLFGRSDEIEIVKNTARELQYVKSLELSTEKVMPMRSQSYIPVIYETLRKIGEWGLAEEYLTGSWYGQYIKKYWRPFIVARRHGYRLKDWHLWFDYVRDLDYLGRDVHNPHYICPADLEEAHAEAVDKCIALRRKRSQEWEANKAIREARRQKKLSIGYTKRMQAYFGIVIVTQSGISITPLKSVEEFAEEGAAMHHCVFTNKYYDRPDSLILSAKDREGKRVETIEVSLNTFRIVQSRGACNKSTPWHDEIVDAMQKGMRQVRAASRLAA